MSLADALTLAQKVADATKQRAIVAADGLAYRVFSGDAWQVRTDGARYVCAAVPAAEARL